MEIYIDLEQATKLITVSISNTTTETWNGFVRMLSDFSAGYAVKNDVMYIPIRSFLGLRTQIQEFAVNHDADVDFSDDIFNLLQTANNSSYARAINTAPLEMNDVLSRLTAAGFVRKLTDNQLNNLQKIGPLPAGATFSVPGAGKTTEALAYFFLNARPDDHLLVVAPKNAFAAWEEQLKDCVPTEEKQFVRLRCGEKKIDSMLRDNPKYALITYQQYPRVSHLIKRYLQQNPTFMYLDESHRIKGGRSGVSADAILEASYLPEKKLIMSGTPMPQSVSDLIPQFTFLYPDKGVDAEAVVDAIQPIYVRTTQAQLGIPAVKREIINLKMSKLQAEVYASIKSEVKRQLMPMLSDASLFSLREIGKKVMKVMEFVSNPALLAKDMAYVFNPHLEIGQCVNNEDIRNIFKCGNMGGMRRSHTTGTLVIVSDYTKGLYHDKWIGGVLHYTGMGKTGDQDLYWSQNATLAKSGDNGVDVHLFEVMNPGEYVYCGRVELVAQPYADTQPDESGMPRRVWMFPVRPVPDNDVKKPKMFVFKDMADYQANGKNVDAEYARALAANRKSGSKTATPVVQVIPKPTPKPVVEIPSEIVGKQIKHKSYGTGIITAINGANISVSFDSVGEKKLGYGICIKNKLIDFI